MDWTEVVKHPVVHAGITGLITAAASDLQAFRSWKSFDDAQQYNWKIAAWRWFQGTVLGALTGIGLTGLMG